MNTYFSSDFHFSHKNIIKYDSRPFKDIDEMDHTMMSNITSQLKKGDRLYYLGDFSFCSTNKAEGFMKALAYTEADLFFIRGNHDGDDIVNLYKKYGTYLGEQKRIKVQYKGELIDIVINHYAMRVWDKSHRGVFHLYGHSHDALDKFGEEWGKSMDCSIVSAARVKGKYCLFEMEDIYNILSKREIKIIDHHGKTDRE